MSELAEWRARLREASTPAVERQAAAFLKTEPGLPTLLLGQCTLDRLPIPLQCEGLRRGLVLQPVVGQFDNVLQDLLERQPASGTLLVLVPWNERLLASRSVADEMVLWEAVFEQVTRLGLKLVMVGYDWVRPEAREVIRAMNAALREKLPPGSFFLDLDVVSGGLGRRAFYDARSQVWMAQPFSEAGLRELARHLTAACRALTVGPKKVLVLDLDNTLWGGEVGELGPLGVRLEGPEGKAFLSFQKYLLGLKKRGVLLAACSKNAPEPPRAAFRENPAMLLKLEDFAAFEACWEPKFESLQRIAGALSLSLDSFVFFDDDARERGFIRQALPEVEVVETSGEPADYVDELAAGLWFESLGVTAEDLARTELYQAEAGRREAGGGMDLEQYLAFLEMKAVLEPLTEANRARVVQLLAKTNQFNLTTRRYGDAEVEQLAARDGVYFRALSLSDRFGEMGLVSLMIAVPDDDALRIDVWLMSCRVLKRTVEHFFLADLMGWARERGWKRLRGEYLPTAKNALVAELLPSMGFQEGFLELEPAQPPGTFVQGA